MEKLKGLLKSRRFYAAMIGFAFVFVDAYVPDFPLTQVQVLELVVLLASYIFGISIDPGFRKP